MLNWIKKNKAYILLTIVIVTVFILGRGTSTEGPSKRDWEKQKKEILDSAAVIYSENFKKLTEENVELKRELNNSLEDYSNYREVKKAESAAEKKRYRRQIEKLSKLSAEELQKEMIAEAERYME